MMDEFVDSFVDDLILDSSLTHYFNKKIQDPRFSWLEEMVNERLQALKEIDTTDPSYQEAKNEALKSIPLDDTSVYFYALKEFNLNWLKQKRESLKNA